MTNRSLAVYVVVVGGGLDPDHNPRKSYSSQSQQMVWPTDACVCPGRSCCFAGAACNGCGAAIVVVVLEDAVDADVAMVK